MSMEHQSPDSMGKGPYLKSSSRELMAAARQARAESLRGMIWGLGRRLRSSIAIYLLPPRKPVAGNASSSREL